MTLKKVNNNAEYVQMDVSEKIDTITKAMNLISDSGVNDFNIGRAYEKLKYLLKELESEQYIEPKN